MEEFLVKLGGTLVMSVALYFGIQLFHVYIEYWISLLISFAVVFGGWLILDSDDFHSI
jgi:hypothetical protein